MENRPVRLTQTDTARLCRLGISRQRADDCENDQKKALKNQGHGCYIQKVSIFAKENKMPVSVCEFKMVAEMMKNGKATGIVVNPASCNVILNKMGVASLEKRFLQ